jgi:hypothetical protein
MRTELVEQPDATIRQFDFASRQVVIEKTSNGSSVVFYPSGRTATPITLTLRGARNERWQLTVSLIGRVTLRAGDE